MNIDIYSYLCPHKQAGPQRYCNGFAFFAAAPLTPYSLFSRARACWLVRSLASVTRHARRRGVWRRGEVRAPAAWATGALAGRPERMLSQYGCAIEPQHHSFSILHMLPTKAVCTTNDQNCKRR